MLNESLLSILAAIVAVFYAGMWVVPVINKRGDEALSGVVRGVPISLKTRRLILFTHYMPLCVFLASFVLVVGLGILELARATGEPNAKAIGFMGAIMCIMGAVVWLLLGGAWFVHTLGELRKVEAGK